MALSNYQIKVLLNGGRVFDQISGREQIFLPMSVPVYCSHGEWMYSPNGHEEATMIRNGKDVDYWASCQLNGCCFCSQETSDKIDARVAEEEEKRNGAKDPKKFLRDAVPILGKYWFDYRQKILKEMRDG